MAPQFEPDRQSSRELTSLALKLAERIAATGPISIHDYMEACLYDPEHGYYIKGNPIGRHGDFITAPEISQVFGELIGLWAGEVWREMGEPGNLRLIELGPGRGTLMADALRALRILPGFLASTAIHLIEASQPLKEKQRLALAAPGCPVFWEARLEDVPAGPAIIIANEFLDCLPVRQYVFDASLGAWCERLVDFLNGRFAIGARPSETVPFTFPPDAHDGVILEYRPGATRLIEALAERASEAPIAALFIDYGYERPSFGETLQAVKAHKFASVFDKPGETDLTAHVDFARLAEAGKAAGLRVYGPMPMGEWLLRLGIEWRTTQLLRSASGEEASSIESGVRRLVDPAQMGALFKVMVLTRGVSVPPPPFG